MNLKKNKINLYYFITDTWSCKSNKHYWKKVFLNRCDYNLMYNSFKKLKKNIILNKYIKIIEKILINYNFTRNKKCKQLSFTF